MPLSDEENATLVKLLLRSAGIAPTEQELHEIIQGYPMLRAGLDALYQIPNISDDLPAPRYSLEEFSNA